MNCRFFPDSTMLFIETTRGFTVWDASTGHRIATMEEWCQGGTTCCRISPDGRELTAVEILEAREGEDHCTWHIGIWDTETWRLKREIRWPHPDYPQFDVAPSGRTLAASCSGNRIEIEDLDTGVRVSQLQLPQIERPYLDGEYFVECWSADSRKVLITSGDGILWLWEIEKPTAVPVSISFDRSQICTSDNGNFFATELTRPISVNSWIPQLPNYLQGPAAWCFGKPGSFIRQAKSVFGRCLRDILSLRRLWNKAGCFRCTSHRTDRSLPLPTDLAGSCSTTCLR